MAAYTINLTDGTVFATIPEGTTNTDSSVTLIGKNYAGYGQFLDDNFIQMLENFSSASSAGNPTVAQLASPLTGQLWWDKTNGLLKVYNGGGWKVISGASASGTQPSSSVVGDLWYNTSTQQLSVCSVAGTPGTFIIVGPAYSSSTGVAGAIPETINDGGGTPHFVTSLYVNNTRVAIVSKDASFTPAAPTSTTYPTIYPGITLTNSGSPVFAGDATNAQQLDSLDSTDFMRATANTATTGRLQVNNANGIYIGTSNVVNISQSTNDGIISSQVSNGNLIIRANVGGTVYNVATALGASGTFAIGNAATVGTTLGVTGNITGGNVIFGSGQVTGTGNVTGGNIAVSGVLLSTNTISLAGNVNAGNLRTGGQLSATGNVTSAANISGTYFLGNGSQLTGLSAAVSVTKITNGTSEANIGTPNGNIAFTVGGTANVVVMDTTTLYGNVLSCQSIAHTGSNAVGNIGSSGSYFNQVFATATTALYADVAERFHADELLEPGTVVELGGTKEITKSRSDLSDSVFGVISTKPAYTMNGGAGEDETHPKVAMTGRVPVKVIGYINKGDRLVSAGNGLARSALAGEATAFNTIGRALENKNTPEQGTIEAIVTIK
jgi:hypothetical protein